MYHAIKKYFSLSLFLVIVITLVHPIRSISQENNIEDIVLQDPVEILGDSLFVQNDSTIDSKGSQEKITDLSIETQELLGEYRLVLQQIDRLIAYNDYVQRLITDQEEQIIDINRQLQEFALIERGIVPLMFYQSKFLELTINIYNLFFLVCD